MRLIIYAVDTVIELDLHEDTPITVETLREQLDDMNTLLLKQTTGNLFILNTSNVIGIDVITNNANDKETQNTRI